MNKFLEFILGYSKLLKKIFPDTIWQSNGEGGKILLTFDDGPNLETTENILSVLGKFNIKAIFFCVGKNIEKYPELAKKIIDEGHLIGNHTYSHKDLLLLSKQGIIREIEYFKKVIGNNKILQNRPKVTLFRPPYGRFDFRLKSVLKKHDMKNIMWSLFTYDFRDNIKKIKISINKYLKYNSIVVMHDNNKSKDTVVETIEEIVKIAREKGFEFANPKEI